jgi:hypothetical protein
LSYRLGRAEWTSEGHGETVIAEHPVAALIGLGAASCRAQGYPASQRGRVDQTVAFTDISVVYGRPIARGRTLFGDSALVK